MHLDYTLPTTRGMAAISAVLTDQSPGWLRWLRKSIAGQTFTTDSWHPVRMSSKKKVGSIGGNHRNLSVIFFSFNRRGARGLKT
jgi:hypothetical protein